MRAAGRKDSITLGRVLLRAGLPAVAAWGIIPLAFWIPVVDATRAPYADLTTAFSHWVFWITQTGGKIGISIIAVVLMMLVVLRGGVTAERRRREATIIFLIALIIGGGGAVFNEYLLKEQMQIPRPNVVRLAGENGRGTLEMAPRGFYESTERKDRSNLLAAALENQPDAILLSPRIKNHWIHQTGYSFPSGHAFSSMFFAVFFLVLASTYLKAKRRVLFSALLPWAVAVAYSRSILGVHSPADITVGAGMGLLLGVCAGPAARMLIRRYA